MKYVLFFPGLDEVHQYKDVGMFPKGLATQGIDVTIVTDKKRELECIEGIKIHYLNARGFQIYIKFILFLLKYGKEIDVLQFFHFSKPATFLASVFKFLNKKGLTYLKLDADARNLSLWNERSKNKMRNFLYLTSFKKFDLMTIETLMVYEGMLNIWPTIKNKLKYLPNGVSFSDYEVESQIPLEQTFLFVGRVGAYQKATEVLLEAYLKIIDQTNFSIKLVGPIEEDFKNWWSGKKGELKKEHVDRIHFLGNINNKKTLRDIYQSAAVFVLPSRWEGASLAILEAAGAGNYIISTNVGSAEEIIDKTKFGELVKVDDVQMLADKMLKVSELSEVRSEEKRAKSKKVIRDNYSYNALVNKLISYMNK